MADLAASVGEERQMITEWIVAALYKAHSRQSATVWPLSRSTEKAGLVVSTPELAPTLARLAEIGNLKPNWDSYGAQPPSRQALSEVRQVLSSLQYLLPAKSGNMSPFAVSPLADGGVQLEWELAGAALEVEVNADGSLGYLFVQGEGTNRKFTEKEDAALDEVLTLIQGLFTGPS